MQSWTSQQFTYVWGCEMRLLIVWHLFLFVIGLRLPVLWVVFFCSVFFCLYMCDPWCRDHLCWLHFPQQLLLAICLGPLCAEYMRIWCSLMLFYCVVDGKVRVLSLSLPNRESLHHTKQRQICVLSFFGRNFFWGKGGKNSHAFIVPPAMRTKLCFMIFSCIVFLLKVLPP